MKKVVRLRMEIYRYLVRCLGRQKWVMLMYVCLLLFGTVIELLTPQLYNRFIDQVLLTGDMQMFGYIAMGYGVLFFAGCTASLVGCMLMNKLRNTLEYRLRLQALDRFIYPGKGHVREKDIGDVKLKMDNDISKLSECLQEQFGKFEVNMILMLVSIVCLFLLDWKLALLGIVAIPATIWIDYKIGQKEKLLNEENRQNDSRMASWLYSVVNGWRQIRVFGQEKNQERKYVRFQHKYALYNAKWINYWVTRVLVIPKLKNEFLMEFGVYFIGGILILQDAMSVGDLLVFIVYYHLLTNAMTAFSAFQAALQSDMLIYLRAMSWDKGDDRNTEGEDILGIEKMELENIRFGYSEELPDLFGQISRVFRKGDCVHIKGESGSGKTTLLKLMLGLEDLKSGRILVNESNLGKVSLLGYYDRIAGCLQGTYLFHASIRENLLYVKPDATEEELEAACERAQVLNDIWAMPRRLDTVVGDRGNRLSGGQCQRILLARAFLKDADVYFFDEVTSALDRQTAVLVLEEIKKLSKEKIVFLVSHDDAVRSICNKSMTIKLCKNP